MDDFLNNLKAQASQLDQGSGQPRLGLVTSVDPTSYTARVAIQPENVLSGWLPIGSSWIGHGWGLACLPSPGDQVVVISQEGNAEHGIIISRLWSTASPPPMTQVGEFWLMHNSGSFLKLLNDGSISSSGAVWRHSGDLFVSGNVSDGHGSLATLRGHYNVHVHPPNDAPPSPTD